MPAQPASAESLTYGEKFSPRTDAQCFLPCSGRLPLFALAVASDQKAHACLVDRHESGRAVYGPEHGSLRDVSV